MLVELALPSLKAAYLTLASALSSKVSTMRPSLSEKIRYLRESAGLSARHADELAGLTRGSSTRFERTAKSPTARAISRICVLYGVSADWLLLGSGRTPKPLEISRHVELRRKALACVSL